MAGTIKELRQQNKAKRQLRRQNRKGYTSGLDLSNAPTFATPTFEATNFSPTSDLKLPQIDNFQKLDIAPAYRNRGEAFNAARKRGDKTFWYGGKEYTTETKEQQDAKLGKTNQSQNGTSAIGASSKAITSSIEQPNTEEISTTISDQPAIWDLIGGKPAWLVEEDKQKQEAARKKKEQDDKKLAELNNLFFPGQNFGPPSQTYIGMPTGYTTPPKKVAGMPGYNNDYNITYGKTQAGRRGAKLRQGGKFPVFRNGGIIGLI